MTIEESIQVLCANVMVAVDRADMGEACSKMVEDALNVAIASLEAWEKVRQEIIKQSAKVPTLQNEYLNGLKTAYAHTLAIIDEHLQEVEHEADN